jgi:methyl-accepting chemotaxis protein
MFVILLALVFVLAAYVMFSVYRVALRGNDDKQRGLQHLQRVRGLLEKVPQHRGAANALLRGDASFKNRLTELQNSIKRDVGVITQHGGELEAWQAGTRLQRIVAQWHEIEAQVWDFSPEVSFARHTDLVNEVIYLMNDIGEESALLGSNTGYRDLIDVLVNKLPLMTEMLGQARGVGTGVAVNKAMSIDNKIKLAYLSNVLHQVNDAISKNMQAMLGTLPDLKAKAQGLLQHSNASNREFLALVDEQLLNARSIEITPEQFYQSGTSAINDNFALLDSISAVAQDRLGENRRVIRQRGLWQQGVSLALVVGAVVLVV